MWGVSVLPLGEEILVSDASLCGVARHSICNTSTASILPCNSGTSPVEFFDVAPLSFSHFDFGQALTDYLAFGPCPPASPFRCIVV